MAFSRGMVLLLALSHLVVTTHSKRLAHGVNKLQRDTGVSSPSSPKNDALHHGVEEVYKQVMNDEKTTPEHKNHAQYQMGVYNEVMTAFAEDSTEIYFAPNRWVKTEEMLSAPKKDDGNQYYEVQLYINSPNPICQAAAKLHDTFRNFLTLTVRYDDIKALAIFFHVVDEQAANSTTWSEESTDDLTYLRDHMDTLTTKNIWGSYDASKFAAFAYRMFRLFFRSTPEVRKLILRRSLTQGLFNSALIRSLPQQTKFVGLFDCISQIDLMNMLPAASPSIGLDNAALQKDLKIKFFDFNEETKKEKDVSSAYDALYKSLKGDEDVLVTCQTEAESSAHTLSNVKRWNPEWILLGHGKHTGTTGVGWTGAVVNAQILNIWVKKPKVDNAETSRWPPDWETKRDWVLDREWMNQGRRGTAWVNKGGGADTLIEAGSIALADGTMLISAKTRLHETSQDGKGGISTILSYQSVPGKPRTRLSFVCGHLDSETQSGREAGAEVLLREATNFAARSPTSDTGRRNLPWKQMIGERSTDKNDVDAIFVTGDLNYRLWYGPEQPLNDNAKMAPMIYTKAGRKELGSYDMLRAPEIPSEASKFSVLTAQFGMQCNQPFESYLPTYKRRKKDACEELGMNKLEECGSFDRVACAQKCSSSDTAGCHECFKVEKTCENLALTCTTGSIGEDDGVAEELKKVVESGTDLGIKTMVFQDPITSKLQLWVTHVEEGKWAATEQFTPGEWMITAVKQTDVDYYHKKMAKKDASPKSAESWKKSYKVKDYKQAADVQRKVVSVLDDVSTETEGLKVRITFVKPKAKWTFKESQFLQMGWLDRLCWKTAPGSSATVSLTSDVALMDSKVSDHMPVHFAASVKRP